VKPIVLFLSSLLISSGANAECRADWRNLARGLDYRAITCHGAANDVDVHVVRIDPRVWQLDAALDRNGRVREVARAHHAAFAINANFFDNPQNPLGVVMRSGTVIQPPRSSSWQSIFLLTKDGRPRIVMPTDWSKYKKDALTAVQAGPRLVVDGHSNHTIHHGYSASRAGVCIKWNRELLFFATPQDRRFDMYEIQKIARRPESEGGLACRDAMLFDGGHSTQFVLTSGDFTVGVNGDPVPLFLYATQK
jgi:uncharacterized protein YigE (DUF2233 family)